MNDTPATKKTAAFTLIEILFIIAIIGVIISLGLSVTKKREQEAKVQKTALQMQQLLQAGMAYYSDKGLWPQKGEKTFIDDYIPAGGIQDPWGNNYSWCPFDSVSSKCSEKQTETDKFQVMTAGKFSSDTALRIRGMLPNAGIKGASPNTAVYTQTSLQPVFLAKVGFLKGPTVYDTFTVSKFRCPVGYISTMHLTLQDFQANERKNDKYMPPFPRKLPSSTLKYLDGGCDASGICHPYLVVFYNDRTSGELYNATVVTTKSKELSLEYRGYPSSFYKNYLLNYAIYCCKVTGPGRLSRYCPNP